MSDAKPNRPGTGAGPTPAEEARRLIRGADRAVLSTVIPAGAESEPGWPFGSLVMVACDASGRPVLLLSDLADHTKNLTADPRASLLFDGTAGLDDPLTGARLTVLGSVARSDDRGLRQRYIARHPGAALYSGFKDFAFYLFTPIRAHLIAGFGRIRGIEAAGLTHPAPARLADAERGLLEVFNKDGGMLANRLAQRSGAGESEGWRVSGIDAEGLDLRRTGAVRRLWFAQPIDRPEQVARAVEALLAIRVG